MADRAPFNTSQLVSFPVFNQTVPTIGPKCIPIFLDFTAANSYLVDLTQMQQQKQIDSVQSIFIDNSNGNVPITIAVQVSKQIIVVPPFAQGVYPLFIPNPPVFTVTSQGNTYLPQLIATNMPLPYMTWNAKQSTSQYSGSGALTVSDAALEAGVVSGYYQSKMFGMSGQQNIQSLKFGTVPYNASGNGVANITVIPATASLGWYVSYLEIVLSPDATAAAAGPQLLSVMEGATILLSKMIYIPNAATNAEKTVMLIQPGQMQLNSKNLNTALNVKLQTGLNAGSVYVNVIGGVSTDTN